MRIAVACSSREIFGSDRSAVRTGDLLAALGHEVTLLVPSARPERGLTALARDRGLRVREASLAIATSRGVKGIVRGRHFPHNGEAFDVLVLNTTAVLPPRLRVRRRILIVREWLDARRMSHRLLARMHVAAADAVVGISHGVLHQWRAVAGDRVQTFLVPNWLADDWFEQRLGEEKCGIVCVGRFNTWKGQSLLAASYLDAFGGASPVPLTFFGAEETGRFARAAEVLKRNGGGRWGVRPVKTDLKPVFAVAAAAALPSLRPEPFGNVLLEALVSGCRVVAFPGGGPDDVAAVLPQGALDIVPRSKDALASWLRRWLAGGSRPQSPELYASVRSVLERCYSQAAAIERWRRLVDTIAE